MKEFFKKYILSIAFSVVGVVAGFLYWRFIGCNSGTCPITSNWYTTVIAGGIIGYLIGDSIRDFILKKRKNEGNME